MSHTAVLVIDIQRGAFNGARCPAIDRATELVSHAGALVAAARASQVPVIFVQHLDAAGEPFEKDSPHGEFHAGVAPMPGEAVVRKLASSAFEDTALGATLQRLGARQLLVCGLQSEFCVSNTSKSALALGYAVRVAQDGHSTWPSNGQSSQAISDAVNAELLALGATVAPTANLVAELRA